MFNKSPKCYICKWQKLVRTWQLWDNGPYCRYPLLDATIRQHVQTATCLPTRRNTYRPWPRSGQAKVRLSLTALAWPDAMGKPKLPSGQATILSKLSSPPHRNSVQGSSFLRIGAVRGRRLDIFKFSLTDHDLITAKIQVAVTQSHTYQIFQRYPACWPVLSSLLEFFHRWSHSQDLAPFSMASLLNGQIVVKGAFGGSFEDKLNQSTKHDSLTQQLTAAFTLHLRPQLHQYSARIWILQSEAKGTKKHKQDKPSVTCDWS